MDNEELLRAGECSKRACCIEPMGHAGPCSTCRCFINDQLLPVRAGCEAVYCKDVNSHTAIRAEALSRLADLQRKLQQAQEERDARWTEAEAKDEVAEILEVASTQVAEAEAERDALKPPAKAQEEGGGD